MVDADVVLLGRSGATWAARSSEQREADAPFQARRPAYVPRQLVPQMSARIEKAGVEHGVHIANSAQAGDGDLHPLIITDPGDDRARLRAQRAFEPILDDVIALGGTVTGEHEVVLPKKRGMSSEIGPTVAELQRG